MARTKRVWVAGIATIVAALGAAYFFTSALATAQLRFWYCGPTSLDHADPACRVGERLLFLSYCAAIVTVAFGILTLWLYRPRPNQSFKPTPSARLNSGARAQ